jgi:DNA-binding winged helix-turn-helix (wHTH) protein/tetratricopeptide (TPR) repeat protein
LIARFAEYEIDEQQSILRRSGVPVPIQPKAFDVLLYLIKARGRLVQKSELLDSLWPDAVVSEHSVVRAISIARAALGDTSPHRYIRSYSRRGYRFVAEVETESTSDAKTPTGDGGDLFVGRDSLVQSLRQELAEAFRGQLRVLLLEGEAGIGKTRTAAELEQVARGLGGQVFSGWCQENEPSAPFQPWLRILSALSQSAGWPTVERALPIAAADVSALLRGDPVGRSASTDLAPSEVRLRLFEAIAAVLRMASAAAPILLVFDDLHAADSSSLRLVEFVARDLRDARVALLLTLRSEEVSLQHPVVPTLAELTRRSRLLRLTLQGLGYQDVARCIEAWTQLVPQREFVEDVHRRSEGNPFFARELARWLSRADVAGEALPPSVRDVVRHRLQRRSEQCLDAIYLAAVIGQDFDVELLLRSAGGERDRALAGLEEAAAARLARPSADDSGRWRFTHTLIRETLLAENSALWVRRAHRTVADALLAMDGDDESRLIERAHHACAGADAATAEDAVACALRAAGRALALTAFEEAARLCGSALRALSLAPGRAPARRIDVLLELGRSLALAGDHAKAAETFAEAVKLADELGDATRKVRAVLGLFGNLPALAPPAPDRIQLLDGAIRGLASEERALRVTALSRLGLALDASGDRERATTTIESAIDEARKLEDPRAVAAALALRATVALPSEPPARRLARVDEALRALSNRESPRVELECRIQRAAALLELGETTAMIAESEAYSEIARRLGNPTARWYAGVQQALHRTLAGDLEGAERKATEAWSAGRRAGHPDANTYLAIQLTQLRYFQGRLAEVEEPLRGALAAAPALAGLRAALSLVLVESGRTREAQRELDALARSRFAALPHDAGWLSNLSLLALVAVSLGSAHHAAELEALLGPYADRNICAFVVASNGATSLFLGLLARATGHHERALTRLREAVAANRRMGLAPWTAYSEQALAEALIEKGGRAAGEQAAVLAASALAAAERIGMKPLIAAARRSLRGAERGRIR